jgi:hypothetical protein
MRKCLFFLLGCWIWGGSVMAGAPPVFLLHTLQGQSPQANGVVLSYILQVQNPGNADLRDITLELVPMLPIVSESSVVLGIASLAARQTTELTFQLHITSPVPAVAELERLPLHWAGSAASTQEGLLAFPATSQGDRP